MEKYRYMVGVKGMDVGACSHRGKVRKRNEDYYYIPKGPKDIQNLLIVADGMGGHNAGDIASFVAVNTAADVIRRVERDSKNELSNEEKIYKAFFEANLRIYNMAQQEEKYNGMGTTMTLALLSHEEAVIGHVGDSRAYLFRGDELIQVTHDHSLVEELVKNGSITADEALHHPQKHYITRSLGTGQHVEIDIFNISLKPEDMLLLCSDGLVDCVSEEKIKEVLSTKAPCAQLAEQLIEIAIDQGGNDNVTAVLYYNSRR